MSGRRWIKFWPQDWQRDPALRICGLAARGLWAEMICIAHEGAPYGHVTVNGKPPNPRQIAAICGSTEKEITRLLQELEDAGVFSRTSEGVIHSRRMVRDKIISDAASVIGKTGGNPNLKGGRTKPHKADARGGDNPPDNRGSNHQEAEAEAEAEPPTVPQGGRRSTLPAFDAWWVEYPRKAGKGAARNAYDRAKKRGATDAELIEGIRRQRWHVDESLRPHPATWLNQDRWQDDPDAGAPAPTRAVPWQVAEMARMTGDEPPIYPDPDDEQGPTIDHEDLFAENPR
jgi:hypothetical protein